MNLFRTSFTFFILAAGLIGCGESDTANIPPKQSAVEQVTKTESTQSATSTDTTAEAPVVNAQVTEARPPAASSTQQDTMETAAAELAESRQVVDDAVAMAASDKPYQLIDGVISKNAIEGWKTYNGGGCGACHGKGGVGAVGPNLGISVTQKLSKDDFKNIVTNGVSGTMMRPHKTNKRVMDNLDNLYAYLMARGDDVLGPGNLIKLPLGK